MKYLSAAQTAEKWGISARRVQILCNEDRIPGAIHVGFVWAIPDDAENRQTRESRAGSTSRKSPQTMKNEPPFYSDPNSK